MKFEELVNELKTSGTNWFEVLENVGIDYDNPLHEALSDTSRWSVFEERVYEYGGRFVELTIENGATEYQDNEGCVDAFEVHPELVSTVVYKRVTV